MRSMRVGLASMLMAVGMGASPPSTAPKPSDELVVHEWGTFLAMGGSDGVVLDGMYHEEHGLPGFVHSRGRDQLRARDALSKGETPVIYFYTKNAQDVRVEVKFPRGLWTQWYPSAAGVFPYFGDQPTPDTLKDGRIVWHASILPAGPGPAPALPATPAGALWDHARRVDAAFVRTHNPARPWPKNEEFERFLFYRGLGASPLPVRFSADSGGTLASDRAPGVTIRHVFVIRVEGGKAAYAYRPALPAGDEARGVIPSMDGARPVDAVADDLADDLAARLASCGLYPKEARAMVETWRASYFATEGVRALFVLPQPWTDGFIPMAIKPAPREVVRVMVGRLELLTPDRERRATDAVAALASPVPGERLAGFEELKAQGRYVEPIVRRVLKASPDERVRLLCRKLLLADFVTELKSAVGSAPEPAAMPSMRVLNEDKVQVRAQLAALLRSVGQDAGAKAEAAAVLGQLKAAGPTIKGNCGEMPGLKAAARALEGMGEDRAAADRYGRMIDLAASAIGKDDCRACHQRAGRVAGAADLRDWWPGDGFVRSIERAGRVEEEAAGLASASSKSPEDVGALARLAYLAAARGRRGEAEAIWSKLEGRGPKLATAPPASH